MLFTIILQTIFIMVNYSDGPNECKNFGKRWKETACIGYYKCLLSKSRELLFIADMNTKLECNGNAADNEIFKFIETEKENGLRMMNYRFQSFSLNEFLYETRPSSICIRQTKSFVNVCQITLRNAHFTHRISISNIETSGIFNLSLQMLWNLSHFIVLNSIFKKFSAKPFHELPCLLNITICNCSLVSLQEDIFHGLTSLLTLHLCSNQIEEIKPLTFKDLYRLELLDLHGNSIKHLTTDLFRNISCLIEFNVEGNQIITLPVKLFSSIPKLRNLILSVNNRITRFPEGFFEGAHLITELHASRCGLKEIGRTLFSLLSDDDDEMAQNENYSYFDNATKMMNAQKVKKLQSENFRRIFLSYNELKFVEDHTFEPLISLEEIDLSNNPILTLPENNPFGPSKSLKRIKLSSCHIFQVWKNWAYPKKLRLLELDNNNISDLPSSMTKMVRSSANIKLLLAGNKWKCECQTIKLIKWMKEQEKKILDYEYVTCTSFRSTSSLNEFLYNNQIGVICSTRSFRSLTFSGYKWETFILLLLFSFLIVYCSLLYRNKLLVGALIRTYILPRCTPTSNKLREGRFFHAFLCYTKVDIRIVKKLVKRLEPSNRLCIHGRDILPVEGRNQMITYSILHSNAALLIISEKFIRSSWFQQYFRLAYRQQAEKRNLRIYSIFIENVQESTVAPELRDLLCKENSLMWNERYFWEKMRYILLVSSK